MFVIKARNVQAALPEALYQLRLHGVERASRNGPVRMFPGPVSTMYEAPNERVIFWPERDANPFFHFMECLWMLAGRNDVAMLTKYAANMVDFSDDGVSFNGAYGYRWRKFFGRDQLPLIINALRANPDDRRQVLQMWDQTDLGRVSRDVPCNTEINFGISHDGRLDMQVHNRSNDMIWGAYGANAVHFSFLQEFMAMCIGVPVGRYWQTSFNFHAYTEADAFKKSECLADRATDALTKREPFNPYALLPEEGGVEPYRVISVPYETWMQDLGVFLHTGPIIGFRDRFFRVVATPIYLAHEHFKHNSGEDKYLGALEILKQCKAHDWRLACTQWVERRYAKFRNRPAKED